MRSQNKWLIKSDYKILGPYSYEQVEDLIMKKQISLIDEVRDMDLRWTYVREVTDFKPLVEAVREEIDKKSDLTRTVQTSQNLQRTSTGTEVSETLTGAHRLDFSQVELPAVPNEPSAVPSSLEVTQKENGRKKNRLSSLGAAQVNEKPKLSFGLKILMAAIAIFLFIGGGWYFNENSSQSKSERSIFQQIRKYNLYAQDDKTIELFKKLPLGSQDKILIDIIPLWVKLEAAGVLSSTHMLDLMFKGKVVGNERKSQYQLVKFNKAFNLGDIQNARDSLVKAIDLDPSAADVKENDALLSLSQKKYSDSARIFKNLYDNSNQGRYLYGFVLSQIYAKTINGPAAFEMLEKHVKSRVEFTKELLFLQIYLIKKGLAGSADGYRDYFSLFVDFPHQMTKYFRLSSLVNRTSYNWEDLESLRQELLPLLDRRDGVLMAINFYLEKGEFSQAQDLFAKNQNILSESDRLNIDVALNYFKKTYQAALGISSESQKLALSSKLYLLMMHQENKSNSTLMIQYINLVVKDKQLFSNWALLMTAKMPEDKEQMKTLINSDRLYANEFLPYLEFKATVNND